MFRVKEIAARRPYRARGDCLSGAHRATSWRLLRN